MWISEGEDEEKQVLFKIVLYGPSDDRVRGSLHAIAELVAGKPFAQAEQSDVVTYDSFELTLGRVAGAVINFLVLTAPAERAHPSVRLLVLKECDGVVFVGGGSTDDEHGARFDELRSHAEELGHAWNDLPVVVQLEGTAGRSPEELLGAWGASGRPFVEVDTARGVDVMGGMKAIAREVLARAKPRLAALA